LTNAQPIDKQVRNVILARAIAGGRRALKPFECLLFVPTDAFTLHVEITDLCLGFGAAKVGRLQEPLGGLHGITVHATSQLVGTRQLDLVLNVAGVSAIKHVLYAQIRRKSRLLRQDVGVRERY
jgi:hypothetical protein